LEVVTWAVAAAVSISESLSLGLGLTYNEGRSDATDEIFTHPPGGLFLPNPFRPEDQISVQLGVVDDTDWSYTAGLLWQINRRFSLGAVYRPGPAIFIEQVVLAGPALPEPEIPPGTVLESHGFDVKLPDVYGLGFAFRARNEALTVSVEWDRVEYSDLLQSLLDGRGEPSGFVQDDGDELRVGLEYVFLRSKPLVATRFGAWRDPDHRFRFEGLNVFNRARQGRGDDELHLAAGVGLALDRYQIDLGADFSDEVNTFSLSAIYTF